MGKKAGKKPAASGASPMAPEVLPPTSFAEALELDPKRKEAEERAMKQRQAKAEAAAKTQAETNAKREWWEKERQKEARQKDREDKRRTQEVAKAKAQAVKEGVFVAETWDEETWWVDLGEGKWQEVKDAYWCSLCNKHLNDWTLADHIQSEAHRKKVEWSNYTASTASAAPAPVPKAAAAIPAAASRPANSTKPEEWQQYDSTSGYWKCIPCNKVVDENHLETADHQKRLAAWLDQEQKANANYPAPELPYLAEVPWDDDPANKRYLKCLLCQKWVNDDWSHSGTPQSPDGSKDHQKYLRNHPPGSPWWEANVTPLRKRWHPSASPGSVTSTVADLAASVVSTTASSPPMRKASAATPSADPVPPKSAKAGGAASASGGVAWGPKPVSAGRAGGGVWGSKAAPPPIPPKAAWGNACPPGAAVPSADDEEEIDV